MRRCWFRLAVSEPGAAAELARQHGVPVDAVFVWPPEGTALAVWMIDDEDERRSSERWGKESPEVEAQIRRTGQRWCECFSISCPEGEHGFVIPEQDCIEVSEADFERARECGWDTMPSGFAFAGAAHGIRLLTKEDR
jgi:hypothetical protein